MLYNIENDPHEQHDLAATHPEICREGAARLLDWHDAQMHSSTTAVDPMWTVLREGGPFHARDRMAPYVAHLRDTGREWAIPELMRRHPGEKV
jgi:hypothetical protein